MREKLTTGKVGFYMMPDSYIGDPPNDAMHFNAKNPEAKLLLTPPAIGPTGKFGSYAAVQAWYYNFFIGDKVDDEKLARILMIFDWLSFDETAKVYSLYGFPDVHFKWAGEPWNSSMRTIAQDDKPENDMGFYTTVNYYDSFFLKYMTQDFRRPMVQWMLTEGGKYTLYSSRVDLLNTTQLAAVNKQYFPDILAKVQEFYIQAIIGEVDINSDTVWNSHQKTLTSMGNDKIVAELQKAPKVAALRAGRIEY
jgi:putative aldouronate transport system substrate-binding protein